MRRRLDEGQGTMEGVVILAVLIVVMFLAATGPGGGSSSGTRTNSQGTEFSQGESTKPIITSSRGGDISINAGNATRSYQTYEEYITLRNGSRDSINITGWRLQNDKSGRVYDPAGQARVYPDDSALIPQATLLLSPTGANIFQNVVLERGETAIITTGKIGVQYPYKIVSFKENMCTGYLGDLDEYTFTPPLNRQCPDPSNEIGVSGLDQECRRFIDRLSRCETPDFDPRDRDGEYCSNCVNNTPLGNSCVAFIKERYNYQGCVVHHSSNQNFYGDTWRVFLSQSWELWAEDYETIKLYDNAGQLVNYKSY